MECIDFEMMCVNFFFLLVSAITFWFTENKHIGIFYTPFNVQSMFTIFEPFIDNFDF